MTKDNWHEIKNWRNLPEMAGYEVMVSAVNPFGQRADFPAFQGYGDFKWYTNDITKMQDVKNGNNAVNECWKITHWTEMPRFPAKVVLRRVDKNREKSDVNLEKAERHAPREWFEKASWKCTYEEYLRCYCPDCENKETCKH